MNIKKYKNEVEIIKLLKEYNNKYNLINEAKSKIDVLINKLGIDESNAKVLDEIMGPLSVWIVNKIADFYVATNPKSYPTKKYVFTNLLFNNRVMVNQLTSIKDYIQIGLNGDKSSLEGLNFMEIYSKSKEWHDSLNVGDSKINYVENHPIILDFRNKDGEGYYWVDLKTNSSTEECERMGHCGRSSKGNLYSLRSYRKVPGTNHTLNKSHLTAAISDNGILYQLKGAKNSKPKEEYHQYILPLFDIKDGNEYLINGFGSEYASQQDFRLTDLPIETLKTLYKQRPKIFEGNSRQLQELMKQLGIELEVKPVTYNTNFEIAIGFSNLQAFIDNDIVVDKQKRKLVGYTNPIITEIYLSEIILEKNYEKFYEYIETKIEYHTKKIFEELVYPGLKSQIERIIQEYVKSLQDDSDDDNPSVWMKDKNLNYLLENTPIGEEISYEIYYAYIDTLIETLLPVYDDTLIQALEQYGNVSIDTRDENVVYIDGDLKEFVDLDDPNVLEIYDDVIHDYGEEELDNLWAIGEIFYRLIVGNYIPTVTWDMPNPNEFDIDEDLFNEKLNDRLNELER